MPIIPPLNNPSSHPLQIFECMTCGYTYTNRTSGLTIKNHYANCSGYPQVVKQLPNVQYCQYCGQDITSCSLGHTCAQGQSSNAQRTCILCGNPAITAANMCLSCFTRNVSGITSGARSAAGAQSFANQYQGVWGTNGSPSYSNTSKDDNSFTKLKERMISTKIIPIDEFDELILILLPLLDQEVIDFLWWEFESNWSSPSYSWVGMQRSWGIPPFFWNYALAQERNKRELAEFDAREARRKEIEVTRLQMLKEYCEENITLTEVFEKFKSKYVINRRKGVI